MVIATAYKKSKDKSIGLWINTTTLGELVISHVDVDGLFATSALRAGMKIQSINGKNTKGMTLEDAKQLIKSFEGEIRIQTHTTDEQSVAVFKPSKNDRCGIGMVNDKTTGNLLVGYINPNGLFSDGKLKIGMKINSINGKCMDGVKSANAAQLIRETKGRIEVFFEVPKDEEDVRRIFIDNTFPKVDEFGDINTVIPAEDSTKKCSSLTKKKKDDDETAVKIITVNPGKLGLAVSFTDAKEDYGGCVIKAIRPTCAFGDKVNVGEHIVSMNESLITKQEDLAIDSHLVRKMGVMYKVSKEQPKKPNSGGKNKPNKPKPGSRPGKNNSKPKPNPGQQGNGKDKPNKPDKLQSTLNGSGGKDKPDKPGRPNNKPDKPNKPEKDEPSFIAVKPNNKPDADSIKPQSKPQQSSYQVVKPSKDKPKPNKPKPNSDSKPNDANSIKPTKPQSNLQIALAYFNITKQDYKQLSAKQKEGILAMTDGQINFDEQQQNDGYLSIGDNNDGGSDSGADGQFNFGNVNSETTDMMEEQTTVMKSLKWNFVQDELTDYSTLLDSFEYTSNLNWDYGNWKVIDSNIAYTKYDNGSKSLMSGINSQVYNQENNGQSIYSNVTLTTNSNFEGGVITFKIQSKTLKLPNEALYVEIDNVVSLAPDVISMGGSSIDRNEEWKEYSIPVSDGKHIIKWVHVYNPFQLKSLPSPIDDNEIGLYMDDIRYVPYTLQEHNNAWTNGMVEMKRGGYVIASNGEEEESSNNDEQHWKISNDGDTVKASSFSIQEDSSSTSSGHSYIQFELYSFNGGLLTYRIKSSTSAPHDDYAISINNINVESIFGIMLGYESHSLSIPRGKAVITLKHRVNPGRLSSDVLRSLESGNSGSDGETLLKDLNFSW